MIYVIIEVTYINGAFGKMSGDYLVFNIWATRHFCVIEYYIGLWIYHISRRGSQGIFKTIGSRWWSFYVIVYSTRFFSSAYYSTCTENKLQLLLHNSDINTYTCKIIL